MKNPVHNIMENQVWERLLLEARVMDETVKIAEKYHDTFLELVNVWSTEMVFTWRWWFELIVVTILPWVLWIIFRKREQTHRLLYGGLFVLLSASILDMIGLCLHLWDYPYMAFPTIPKNVSWDFCAMPVTIMLSYQSKPNMRPWIKALIYSFIASFVVQPIATWMLLYNPMGWKNWYSFPFIFVIYISGYYLYKKAGSDSTAKN